MMENESKMREGQTVVWADFNGLFGDILCLTHSDCCPDESGNMVQIRPGLKVLAFDEDINEAGERDDLVAMGVVEPAPEGLARHGSKWVLRIDEHGVRHKSELPK
jgi:hypothetical protein